MIESNINEGNQKTDGMNASDLKYGVSITDACIHWEDTEMILNELAQAQKARKSLGKA